MRHASWEITDPLLRTRFNPCGMVWTYLRSCYSFPMRVYIGGVAQVFSARWFFCLESAAYFPSPHGGEASVWLKNYERNDLWGEVTPFPTDPDADFYRGLDRGLNPGYRGQQFIGQYQWFVDGQLPGGILDGPIPAMCPLCLPSGVASSGGLVMGGAGARAGNTQGVATGGVVLGGVGAGSGPHVAGSSGGLVMGGVGAAQGRTVAGSEGGLVLGGVGVGSGGGGGGITTPCCPNPIPTTLYAHVAAGSGGCSCTAQVVPINYASGVWDSGPYVNSCGRNSSMTLACVGSSASGWQLAIGTLPATLTSASCGPPLQLVYSITDSTGAYCLAPGGVFSVTIKETP